MVVVDACQLRCSFEDIRADLESGFMVMITGSKFAGGPPFCGALLISPALADRLEDLEAPGGLAADSARFDWPKRLRSALRGPNIPHSILVLACDGSGTCRNRGSCRDQT